MTDAQAKQINEMRMKGMGYKAIGMAIGLSRDIVRNYCKRHNLAGYATVVSKNMKLMVDGKEVCHFCGNPITQPKTGRPRRFCCEKCRREWWKAHPEAVKKSEKASYTLVCDTTESASNDHPSQRRLMNSNTIFLYFSTTASKAVLNALRKREAKLFFSVPSSLI